MNDATRIEETYRLPDWARRAAAARLAAVAAAEAKFHEARDDLAFLLHHIRTICGDEDARAWFLAIGVSKATLRRFWRKAGGNRKRAIRDVGTYE